MMTKDKIKYRPIEEPYHLPRIGMRIFKTMVAVLICLGLSLFRGEHSIPFYSAIATILCMQPYVGNSVKVALNRVVGTMIGAVSVSYTHLDVYKRQVPHFGRIWELKMLILDNQCQSYIIK